MESRVTERQPDGRAMAGIICCSADPWHVEHGINRAAWSRSLALAERQAYWDQLASRRDVALWETA